MKDIKEFLLEMGFGKNETEIYSALTEIGTSSVLQISKKTGLHRSNIYDALRKLLKEGLVFEINRPTKLFYARPPRSLLNFIKRKEAELDEIIKDYESRIGEKKETDVAKLTKGVFSIRESINNLLEKNAPIYVFGTPENAPDTIGPMLKDFHKSRIQKKIHMYQIYNTGAEKRVEYLNKMRFTEAKVLPSKYNTPVTTVICKDSVILQFMEGDYTIIEIDNEQLAKAYKNYFDILWSKAKKVV